MKRMSALCVMLLIAVPTVHATDASRNSFKRLPGKAVFLRGDNLVTHALPEIGASRPAALQTPQEKAAGLSAVMVTPNGDLYESRMDPQDVAIFEKAIKDLERLGRNATTFGTPPTLPLSGAKTMFTPLSLIHI